MEESQGKKKRNKRSGGAYEHGLMTEYESVSSKREGKIEEKSPYNDLPTINMPDKKEEPNYIEDAEAGSELSKIVETKISKEFLYFDIFKTALILMVNLEEKSKYRY
jgi:hypothetical protein